MSVSLHFTRLDPETETDAPPLVIAHGLFGQGRNFGTLARGFVERRPVISVDMRNHGDSPWDQRMDYDAMADDLAEVVEREAGGRASLLGHSMGGKAAMALALKYPSMLAACVIADIAPVAYEHTYYREISAMRSLGLEGISRRSQADAILKSKVPVASMRAFLLQNLSVSPEGARWKPNLDAIADNIGKLTGWEEPEDASSYDGPTLFLKGGDSGYVRDDQEMDIKYLFPRAAFEKIQGVGHWLHAEAPKKFFASVDGFLSRNGL